MKLRNGPVTGRTVTVCKRQVAPAGDYLDIEEHLHSPHHRGILCLKPPLREGWGLQAALECASMGKSHTIRRYSPD